MGFKFNATAAKIMLNRLDRISSDIQTEYKAWGIPEEKAKAIVLALDKTADEIEGSSFGEESFRFRQAETAFGLEEACKLHNVSLTAAREYLTRQAQVIQRDPDEGYMNTFSNPQEPIQTDADEGYMRAYGAPDQSSVVQHGKTTTGRPLAPGHGPFTSGT